MQWLISKAPCGCKAHMTDRKAKNWTGLVVFRLDETGKRRSAAQRCATINRVTIGSAVATSRALPNPASASSAR